MQIQNFGNQMAKSACAGRRAVFSRLTVLFLFTLLLAGLLLPSPTRAEGHWAGHYACDAPGVWCPPRLSLRTDAFMQENQNQADLSIAPEATVGPGSALPLNIVVSVAAAGCFGLAAIALLVAIVIVWQRNKRPAAPVPAPSSQARSPARPPTIEPAATWGRLAVTGGPAQARSLDLVHPSLTIGRSATNDLVLPDNRVSRKHALIERRAGAVIVTDLGSNNGTFVNGRQVHDSQPLSPGAFIRLGNTELAFHPPGGRTVPAPAQRPSVLSSSQPRRLSLDGEAAALTLGRGLDCDIVLADRHVSRRHAQIRKESMVTLVQDLGSTHGTFVNGMRINQPTPLCQGDVIRVGNSELVI